MARLIVRDDKGEVCIDRSIRADETVGDVKNQIINHLCSNGVSDLRDTIGCTRNIVPEIIKSKPNKVDGFYESLYTCFQNSGSKEFSKNWLSSASAEQFENKENNCKNFFINSKMHFTKTNLQFNETEKIFLNEFTQHKEDLKIPHKIDAERMRSMRSIEKIEDEREINVGSFQSMPLTNSMKNPRDPHVKNTDSMSFTRQVKDFGESRVNFKQDIPVTNSIDDLPDFFNNNLLDENTKYASLNNSQSNKLISKTNDKFFLLSFENEHSFSKKLNTQGLETKVIPNSPKTLKRKEMKDIINNYVISNISKKNLLSKEKKHQIYGPIKNYTLINRFISQLQKQASLKKYSHDTNDFSFDIFRFLKCFDSSLSLITLQLLNQNCQCKYHMNIIRFLQSANVELSSASAIRFYFEYSIGNIIKNSAECEDCANSNNLIFYFIDLILRKSFKNCIVSKDHQFLFKNLVNLQLLFKNHFNFQKLAKKNFGEKKLSISTLNRRSPYKFFKKKIQESYQMLISKLMHDIIFSKINFKENLDENISTRKLKVLNQKFNKNQEKSLIEVSNNKENINFEEKRNQTISSGKNEKCCIKGSNNEKNINFEEKGNQSIFLEKIASFSSKNNQKECLKPQENTEDCNSIKNNTSIKVSENILKIDSSFITDNESEFSSMYLSENINEKQFETAEPTMSRIHKKFSVTSDIEKQNALSNLCSKIKPGKAKNCDDLKRGVDFHKKLKILLNGKIINEKLHLEDLLNENSLELVYFILCNSNKIKKSSNQMDSLKKSVADKLNKPHITEQTTSTVINHYRHDIGKQNMSTNQNYTQYYKKAHLNNNLQSQNKSCLKSDLSLNRPPPCKSDVSPCKSDHPPCESYLTPCKTDHSPCESDVPPCKTDHPPCESCLTPCKSDHSPCKSDVSPCKSDVSPCKTAQPPCESIKSSFFHEKNNHFSINKSLNLPFQQEMANNSTTHSTKSTNENDNAEPDDLISLNSIENSMKVKINLRGKKVFVDPNQIYSYKNKIYLISKRRKMTNIFNHIRQTLSQIHISVVIKISAIIALFLTGNKSFSLILITLAILKYASKIKFKLTMYSTNSVEFFTKTFLAFFITMFFINSDSIMVFPKISSEKKSA